MARARSIRRGRHPRLGSAAMSSLAASGWRNPPNECSFEDISKGALLQCKLENSQWFWNQSKRAALPCASPPFQRSSPMERTRPRRWQWQRTPYGWFSRIAWLKANRFQRVSRRAFAKSWSRSPRERAVAGHKGERCHSRAAAGWFCDLPNIRQPMRLIHTTDPARKVTVPLHDSSDLKRGTLRHHCPSGSCCRRILGALITTERCLHAGVPR